MIKPLSEVAKDAIELSQDQRLTLARILLDCSETPAEPATEVEEAWTAEIARRIRAVDSGETKGIPLSDVLTEIDQRLGR